MSVGRSFAFILAGLLAIAPTLSSVAQEKYPGKPVRVLVGVNPGGATDVLARIVAHQLSAALDGNFVVENRPGAGGTIAANEAAKAQPDGSTLLISAPTVMVVSPYLYKNLPFSPKDDFVPVSLIAAGPLVLAVNPAVPAKDLPELLQYLRANPGKVSFGSGGQGTASHLTAELFSSRAGVEMVHVPYRGDGQALNDLLGGHVQLMFTAYSLLQPHVDAGTLRILATTALERPSSVSQLPTLHESGLTGLESFGWIGLYAPKGTPAGIIDQLNAAWQERSRLPEVQKQLEAFGGNFLTIESPEAFATFQAQEAGRWADVIQDAGVTPE